MKIVYVYTGTPGEWNSELRTAVPARAINRTGRHSAQLLDMSDFTGHTPNAQEACSNADMIVIQRCLSGPVLPAIQHWMARDKVIIADIDEFSCPAAEELSPPASPAQPGTGDPAGLEQFKWGLRMVHAATLSSPQLADDWRSYTETYFLPSYLDLKAYQNSSPQPHEGIRIGWGGDRTHLDCFTKSGLAEALRRICRARPQVRVKICGSNPRILELLALPPAQASYQPWVSNEDWPGILSGFDIGLAPLQGASDQRRSWAKVLEYLVMRIPWVASSGPPYYDLRQYGWLVNNTPYAWERVLLDMVDNLQAYKDEAGREAYLYGIGQNVDENVERILQAYADISAKVNNRQRI
jgi:hypothetical protein